MKIVLFDKKKKKIDVQEKNEKFNEIPESGLKPDKFYQECRKPLLSDIPKEEQKKYIKMRKKHPDRIVLIKMEMSNGNWREFYAVDEKGSFYFNDMEYVFDLKMKYFIIERNIWAYNFHEFFVLPFKINFVPTKEMKVLLDAVGKQMRKPSNPAFPLNEVRELIESSNIVEVENSLNPSVLKRFTDANVIEQVIRGATLGRIFKVILILLIVVVVMGLISLIISLYSSGVFEKISGLFGNK